MQVCISRKDAHPKMKDGMLQRKDERRHTTEFKGVGFGNRHYHLLCDLGILCNSARLWFSQYTRGDNGAFHKIGSLRVSGPNMCG